MANEHQHNGVPMDWHQWRGSVNAQLTAVNEHMREHSAEIHATTLLLDAIESRVTKAEGRMVALIAVGSAIGGAAGTIVGYLLKAFG